MGRTEEWTGMIGEKMDEEGRQGGNGVVEKVTLKVSQAFLQIL